MEEFTRLVKLMETLRSEQGCPWDRKQTTTAFKTYLLEEVYEIIEAIDKGDSKQLREEMGDVLFHIVFIAQICRERSEFDIRDVVEGVYKKMKGRHPHVFEKGTSAEPIEKRWEEIKREEKKDYEPLAGVPATMPALLRAFVVTKRAARVGFDWPDISDVYTKLFEEIDELKSAQATADSTSIREEIGDTLFTIVNLARFLNTDPEDALRSSTEKFIRRFSYIEKNIETGNTSLEAMDELWNRIKKVEREKD